MRIKLLFLLLSLSVYLKSQTVFNLGWTGGVGSPGNELMNASTVDASGNVYLTGRITGTVDFDLGPGTYTLYGWAHSYVAKYSTTGALIWANVLSGGGASAGTGIGVDGLGNVYVAGNFNGSDVDFDPSASTYSFATQGSSDMFLEKFNSSGGFVWAKTFGSAAVAVYPYYMNVSSAGDIVVSGDFNGTVDFDGSAAVANKTPVGNYDGFVMKYNASGNYQWAFNVGDANNDYAYALDVDASGNVYVAGSFQNNPDFDPSAAVNTFSSNGSADMFLAKYTSAGNFVWVSGAGGSSNDDGYRVKVDAAGNVILSGAMTSSTLDADPSAALYTLNKVGSGNADAFIGKYNGTSGAFIWAQNTGGSGDVIAYNITSDSQNNIYLAGGFDGSADFDFSAAGTNSLTTMNSGNTDIFLAKYDLNGGYILAKNLGGGSANGDNAYSINLDASDNIYIAGCYANTIDFDFAAPTTTLNMYGGTDIFVAKYSQCIFPTLPTLSTNFTNICAGQSVNMSVVSGSLNSATNWVWYTGSCGGTSVAIGTSQTLSPSSSTQYYVRAEGGCITAGGTCASLAITVNPLTDFKGQVTTNTVAPVPVAGYVTLYEYLPTLTKFDSITSQNLDGSGNYNFTSVPAKNYIILAVPTLTNLQTTYAPSEVNWKTAVVVNHGCSANTIQNINVIPLTSSAGGPGVFSGTIVEGLGYGQKGTQVMVPGNPIKGVVVKGGRNPGGDILTQSRTNAAGQYTLDNFPLSSANESYFILVDVPGLDTNGTYHKVITSGVTQYANLDFNIDSIKINPSAFVGIKENKTESKLLSVYPNPASVSVYVELEITSGNIAIELTDLLGRTVKTFLPETNNLQGKSTLACPLQSVNAGIYLLKIKTGDKWTTSKLIVSDK